MAGMDIKNLDKWFKKMDSYAKHIEHNRKKNMLKAVQMVRRDAVRLCPRSPLQAPPKDITQHVSGRLKTSIAYEITNDGKVGRIGVSNEIKYAKVHEFGYAPRNIPPRPYMRPAFFKNKEAIIKMFGEILKYKES